MESPQTGAGGPVRARPAPSTPAVSIIVPAYNEAHRIRRSIKAILQFVNGHRLASEVIIVDDGSTDGTGAMVSAYGNPAVRVVTNRVNRGKGYSVRRGFLEASGEWVLFTDADLSAPIEELDRLLEVAAAGADVVIGSRAVDRSKIAIRQSRFRETGGIFFNWMVQLVLGLPIRDTQCGFKLFRREKMAPVFALQKIHGFGFDPEILFLARKHGLIIREVPVVWSHDAGTKVRFVRDGIQMFLDLARIRWNWTTGRYRSQIGNEDDQRL